MDRIARLLVAAVLTLAVAAPASAAATLAPLFTVAGVVNTVALATYFACTNTDTVAESVGIEVFGQEVTSSSRPHRTQSLWGRRRPSCLEPNRCCLDGRRRPQPWQRHKGLGKHLDHVEEDRLLGLPGRHEQQSSSVNDQPHHRLQGEAEGRVSPTAMIRSPGVSFERAPALARTGRVVLDRRSCRLRQAARPHDAPTRFSRGGGGRPSPRGGRGGEL
jgi:hypothetical protein